jgi:hypothetical protein
MSDHSHLSGAAWLNAGGEMGALRWAKDWSGTPLGPVEAWPQNDPRHLIVILR